MLDTLEMDAIGDLVFDNMEDIPSTTPLFDEIDNYDGLDLAKRGQAGRSLIKGFAAKLKRAGFALTTHVGERIAKRLQGIGIRVDIKDFLRAFRRARHYKQPGRKTRIAVVGGDIPVVYRLTGRAGNISGRRPLLVTVLPPLSMGGSLPTNITPITKKALNFRFDMFDDLDVFDIPDRDDDSSLDFLDGWDLVDAATNTAINRKSKAYILWLQKQLNRIESAGLKANGIMGSNTRKAIRAFKKKYSIGYPPNDKPNSSLEAFLIMFGAPPPPGTSEPKRFNPSNLPAAVYEAFKKGPSAWKHVLQRALDAGYTDVSKLADIMFFLAHPERKGRQINSSETKAIQEWNNWRDKIKPIVEVRLIASKKPDLIEMLKQVPVNRIGKDAVERLRLVRLQEFLIRGLIGEQVDDRFWKFTGSDGYGRIRAFGKKPCNYKGTIFAVERRQHPGHAIADFKRYCRNARNVKNVSWCLYRVHNEILCHANVLLGWATHVYAFRDASLRNYQECAWLLELKSASLRKAPKSVYSCFAPLFRNVHKTCT